MLRLRVQKLLKAVPFCPAFASSSSSSISSSGSESSASSSANCIIATQWVKLSISSPNLSFHSYTVHNIVALDSLCSDIILGLLFLSHNHIVVHLQAWTAISKLNQYNLLNSLSCDVGLPLWLGPLILAPSMLK